MHAGNHCQYHPGGETIDLVMFALAPEIGKVQTRHYKHVNLAVDVSKSMVVEVGCE
jgi:hypothetical protein